MTTFLLIRHASFEGLGRRIAGWTPGVGLDEEGRVQARGLAERLKGVRVAAVYSSPLERARETAEPLAASLGLEVRPDEAFGEIRYGEWTGLDVGGLEPDARWRRYNHFRSGTRPPGGELMLEVQARFVGGLERLAAAHAGEAVAVFSHADAINAALMYYLGTPLDFFFRIEISPASVSILRLDEWGPKVLLVNDTGEVKVAGDG